MNRGSSKVAVGRWAVTAICIALIGGSVGAQVGPTSVAHTASDPVVHPSESGQALPPDAEAFPVGGVMVGGRWAAGVAGVGATWGGGTPVGVGGGIRAQAASRWPVQFASDAMQWVTALGVDAEGTLFAGGYVEGTVRDGTPTMDDGFVRALTEDGRAAWDAPFATDGWDRVTALAVGPDGAPVVVGPASPSPFGALNGFVRAFDANGRERWVHRFGTDGDDEPTAVAVGSDGRIYVAGHTTGAFDGGATGASDGFVQVLDGEGREVWTRQFGTEAFDDVTAVAVGPGGTVLVAGRTQGAFEGPNRGGWDGFVHVLDAEGRDVWTRQFGTEAADGVAALAVGSDGTVFVGGATDGALAEEHAGGSDGFVRALSVEGRHVWTHQFGTDAFDAVQGVAVTGDGAVVAAGTTEGQLGAVHTGASDGFVRALDPEGRAMVTRQFGTDVCDAVTSVVVAPAGGVFVAGDTCGEFGGANPFNVDGFVHRVSLRGP